MKKYILTLFAAVLAFAANAEDSAVVLIDSLGNVSVEKPVEMADKFYSNGGIFVVIAVIAIVLMGLFGYMIYVDKRLGKIEREQKN